MASSKHLVVFNQYAGIDQIIDLIQSRKAGEVTLLSSHALYPVEKEKLKDFNVQYLNFTECTTQELAEKADMLAYQEVKENILMYSVYVRSFKERSVYHKNRLIFEHIGHSFNYVDVCCGPIEKKNLNISHSFWRSAGALIHYPTLQPMEIDLVVLAKRITSIPFIARLGFMVNAYRKAYSKIEYSIIEWEGVKWYFPTLKRIRTGNDVVPSKKMLRPVDVPKDALHAVPLHSSYLLLNLNPVVKRKNVTVVQDAFRPSVYPTYLFADAFTGCGFIPRDAFDRKLFSRVKDVHEAEKPTFLRFTKAFDPPDVHEMNVQTIVLSLNHAGDWTAEISRADTDLLIMAFMELAQNVPNKKMIIRLHPTMDSVEGEGIGASDRIREIVSVAGIENIEVSDKTLEEDWDRGDLFISEYSLSAIDALSIGKPVLFVNLTNRRSYMEDYQNLGFVVSTGKDSFFTDVKHIMEDPAAYYSVQVDAYRKYLHNFSRFEQESKQ